MRTLEYYYKELIESPDKWNYYEYPSFSYEEFQNGMCQPFITNYLGKGGKTELPVFEYINIIDEKRIWHIVSCFFLGMILYHKIPKLQKYIKKYLTKFPRCEDNNESDEQRFAYLWMLICLFHDNGYVVEHKKKTVTQSEIEDYLKKFPKNNGFVPSVFSKELLQHYNDYIECKKSHQDHGIICGIEIYSELCELRKKKENVPTSQYWKKDLEQDFAIVSWIIACHNIFFIDENDINLKCYNCKNLKVLIRKDNDSFPITLKKHPIFLLFCLVDSIEPIKVLDGQNALNDIDCDIEDLKFDFGKLCSSEGIEYEHKPLSLKKWLTNVTIEEDSGKRIVHIELNCK